MLAAIALGGLIGLTVPASTEVFSHGIDTTVQVMIFLLFFELQLGPLLSAFQNVRFLLWAWSANFLIIPLIAFGIASLIFAGQPLLFAGLMIYLLAPCTDWFLGFTRLAKGDTELGASLIPVNIITQLVLFPVWLWLFANETGLLDFTVMPTMLLQWFVVPLFAAQSMRIVFERVLPKNFAAPIVAKINHIVPFALAALVMQIFATHIGAIAIHLHITALVAVGVSVFFVSTFIVGERLSWLAHFDYPQRALLATTMAARNAPLMLGLTALVFPNEPMVLAVIVAGMLVEIPLLMALNRILLNQAPDQSGSNFRA